MANLKISLLKTLSHEGVWSNDPDDSGGRTYKGIAEASNPKWSGWKIIDLNIDDKNFPKCLESNVSLQNAVEECYRTNYWNKISGDKILNQKIADNLFDTAVNMGPSTAIKLEQRAIKCKETGYMDNTTLNILNQIV